MSIKEMIQKFRNRNLVDYPAPNPNAVEFIKTKDIRQKSEKEGVSIREAYNNIVKIREESKIISEPVNSFKKPK